MASIGDGVAVGAEIGATAVEAVRSAVQPLGGAGVPDLVCVFVSGADPAGVEAAARAAADTGARVVLGCTAAGVIGGGRGHERVPAVSAWAARLPGARLRPFHLTAAPSSGGWSGPGSLAGGIAGLPAFAPDDCAALLLADPATFPATSFVGSTNVLGVRVPGASPLPFVGAVAGAPGRSCPTRLVLNGRVVEEGAVGVVFGGAVQPRVLLSQGCRPIGPLMAVTRVEGDVVVELAGRPALRMLGEVLDGLPSDDRAVAATGLQLGLVMDEYADEHAHGDFLIRAVLGSVPGSGGLVLAEPIELGTTVRFHVRDARTAEADLAQALSGRGASLPTAAGRLMSGATPPRVGTGRRPGAAGRSATGDPGGQPGVGSRRVEGALLFSSAGRGTALFPTANHDVLAVRRGLRTRPVAGCFSVGEVAPAGGRNHVHGSSAAVLAFESVSPAED